MVSRLPLALLCALVPLLAPASAHAALTLTHQSVDARETTAAGDGVLGPGDRVYIDHTFTSATPLTNPTGTIGSAVNGVTWENAATTYEQVAPNTYRSRTPYEAVLQSTGLECGSFLTFTATVAAGGDTGPVSFSVATGASGPWEAAHVDNNTDVPIADDGTPTVLELLVPSTDGRRIKDLRVRIPQLTHPRVGDLKLELIGPDGTTVVLADGRGGDGDGLTDTVFADGGSALAGGSAPYTGTFAPEQALSAFTGRRKDGAWKLRVTDTVAGESGGVGSWSIATRRAYCQGIPRAQFTMTPSQVLPGGTVQFDASSSYDTDGLLNTNNFEFDLDGDGVYEIGPTNDRTHSFTYPATKRAVMVSVRVTDAQDLVDVETKRLPVTAPPTAAFAAPAGTPETFTPVTFTATGSTDPDGTIAKHEWDLDGDGMFETDTGAANSAQTSYETPGTRTVGLRVTDDTGATATTTRSVAIANRLPVAAIAVDGPVVVGRTATLSAEASTDQDGTLDRYHWDLDGNGTYEVDGGYASTYAHVFTAGGSRTVGVKVFDDRGASDTETLTFTVRHAPTVALAATPNPVSLRRTATLDAAGTTDADSAFGALTFAWDLDADGDYDDATGAGPHSVSFATAGTRRLGVRVSDPDGAQTVKTVDLVVRNVSPTAALAGPAGSVDVNADVTLSAAGSSDPDGTIVKHEWDLDGDGHFERDTGTTATATTSFPGAGTARPFVRVTDDDGATAIRGVDVSVKAPTPSGGGSTGGSGSGGGDASGSGGGATGTGTGGGAAGGTTGPGGATPATTSPGVPAPGSAGAPRGGTAAQPGAQENRLGAVLSGVTIQRLKGVLKSGLALGCEATAAGRCVVEAELSAAHAKRLGIDKRAKKPVKIGRASALVDAGVSKSLRLKLTARAVKALRRAKTVRIVLRGFARDRVSRRVELTRVVLVRR